VKRALWILLGVVVVLVAVFLMWGPTLFDRVANRVLNDGPYVASQRGERLYQNLFVVDLHADPLLWDRDLSKKASHGAVDLPRLVEGNVAIQSFFIVTKSPWGQNIDSTSADSDAIGTLVAVQGWPRRTWDSLFERALYQASVLEHLSASSGGAMVILKSKADLEAFRVSRAEGEARVAGILGLEGAHALEADVANLDALVEAGIRIIAPTHFFDNAIGGSAHGVSKGGLTQLGKRLITMMEERSILLDLAHASAAVIDGAVEISTRPVIVSHTGVRGTCDNNRNLTDEQIRKIASTGGVIGIGYWNTAVCGEDAASVARAIMYTANLVGAQHVALGSDFDGAVPVPFDTTGLPLIVDALLEQGMSEADIRLVMGENAFRVFAETLP
jgi:microsomal dipeptidase-like Zn-dependent dipeptidase